MSVNKTRQGTYMARYRDAAGREHTRTFKRQDLARQWENTQRASVSRGDWVDPRGARTMLRDYAEHWRSLQHHRDRTAIRSESALRVHIYPTFGHRRIGAIRTSEVQAWVKTLELAPSTVKIVHGYLASVFHSAVVDRLIPVSPCESIRLPRVEKPALKVMSVTHVLRVTEEMRDGIQAAVPVAAGTGLRQSELLGLTIDRIDFLRRTLKVDRQLVAKKPPTFGPPKSNAGYRTVPLASWVVDKLAAHLEQHGAGAEGLVFSARDGLGVHRVVLQQQFKAAVERAGLPGWVSWHSLRDFYASALIHGGCNVKQVQTYLGHESAKVTLDTYAALWPASEDQVRSAIEDVFVTDSRSLDRVRPVETAGRPL